MTGESTRLNKALLIVLLFGVVLSGFLFLLNIMADYQPTKMQSSLTGGEFGSYSLAYCVESPSLSETDSIVMRGNNSTGQNWQLDFVHALDHVFCTLDTHFVTSSSAVETIWLTPSMKDFGFQQILVYSVEPGGSFKHPYDLTLRSFISLRASHQDFVFSVMKDPDPSTNRVFVGPTLVR